VEGPKVQNVIRCSQCDEPRAGCAVNSVVQTAALPATFVSEFAGRRRRRREGDHRANGAEAAKHQRGADDQSFHGCSPRLDLTTELGNLEVR